MPAKSVAEILKSISEISGNAAKASALREQHSIAMEIVVNLAFNENIEWLVPEGTPPYTPAKKNMNLQNILYSNTRKFDIFVKGKYDNLPQRIREQRYIEFLESIDPDDAILIISARSGSIPYPRMTRKLFELAWPALAATWSKPT